MNGNGHNHELDNELLSAYIDGELTDAERAAVDARLATDAEAQHLLHQLRSVSQDVQSLPLKPAPRDLRDQILSRIETTPIARKAVAASAPAPDVKTTTTPLAFQGRRPWIWASLAVAAGLMIMFLTRGNNDRDNVAAVSNEPRGRVERHDSQPKRELSVTENKPASAVADPAMFAKSESVEAPAALGGPAPSAAAPPPNVADLSGQVAATGRRMDESSSRAAIMPAAPQGGATLSDVPSDEAIRDGKLVTLAPSPPPGPAPVNRSAVPAAAPATPGVVPISPQQNVGMIAQDEVTSRAGTAKPTAAPDQLADMRKKSAASGNFAGGGGGGFAVNAKNQWQLLDRDDSQAPTLVVHVVAKKYALDNKAFEDLLAKNHIQFEPESTTLAFEEGRRAGGTADRTPKTAEADRFARQPAEKPPSGEQFEFVEVEAPQQSIVSCLTELKQDSANYAGVAIENPATGAESKAKTDLASADKKLGTDLSLYARGVVPQTQKDAVSQRFYAYRNASGQAGAVSGEATSATSELLANGRDQTSRKKLEIEQLKEATTPATDQPAAAELNADKSTLGRARRVGANEMQNRGLGRASASSGQKPRDEDVAKRVQSPADLGTLAKQTAGNLRVLFVIGEEPPTATSAPASEKSK